MVVDGLSSSVWQLLHWSMNHQHRDWVVELTATERVIELDSSLFCQNWVGLYLVVDGMVVISEV